MNYLLAQDHISRPRPKERMQARIPAPTRRTLLDTRNSRQEEQLEMLRLLDKAVDYEGAVAINNAIASTNNEPIFHVLEQTTGAQVLPDPAEWRQWWDEYNELQSDKRTYYEYRPTRSAFATRYQIQYVVGHSCFAEGTRVWTQTGLVPIEKIEVGDRVLAQNPETGELAYKAVLQTTAGPPVCGLLTARIEREEIEMTEGHVVWVINHGWRMAKHLSGGERLHGLRGGVHFDGADPIPPAPQVYNLVVADFNTYFVGQSGILVHDITFRNPTTAVIPGLLPEAGTFALGSAPGNLHRQFRQATEEFGR